MLGRSKNPKNHDQMKVPYCVSLVRVMVVGTPHSTIPAMIWQITSPLQRLFQLWNAIANGAVALIIAGKYSHDI